MSDERTLDRAFARLDGPREAQRARAAIGSASERQPVHTVYGGAHLFRADLARRMGERALAALEAYAPGSASFATALGFADDELSRVVHARVLEKLAREPVEDLRIDFEDGFGVRPDDEEDATADVAAAEMAKGMAEASLPPFVGIRVKSFSGELRRRGARTLRRFVRALVGAAGALPENFVVTLPKIVAPEEVEVLVELLAGLERELGLVPRSLRFEIMIETPESVLGPDGGAMPGRLAARGDGRCVAAHFGTYDYTALCDVTASHQTLDHPACDFARHVMQVSLAGTGVRISDGATNVLPVPIHRAPEGASPTTEQEAANRRAVHAAWKLHHAHVRRSLEHAYYQGWDLHPAQLPTRYAAVFRFFLAGLEAAGARLTNFVSQAARATLVGDVFDDAATGQGLLNYFLRAINCGAVTEEEALAKSGLTHDELATRSFLRILEGRQG